MIIKKVNLLVILVVLCFATASVSLANTANYQFINMLTDNNNNTSNTVQMISVAELKAKFDKKESVVILDVRGGDYASSTTKIKGAIRVAPGEVEKHLKDIPKDKMVVTYCSCPTEGGAITAAQVLLNNGFKQVYVLKGGWPAWNTANGLVEPK